MNMHTRKAALSDQQEWGWVDISGLAETKTFSPALPLAALPTVVRGLVEGLSCTFQVPIAYVLTTIIVVTLGLIGGSVRIRAGGQNEAASLFGLNVGVSGARKTSAMAPIIAIVREIEKAELERLNLDFKNFGDPEVVEHMKIELGLYREALKAAIKAGSDHLPAMNETLKRYTSGAAAPAPIVVSKVTPQGLLDAVAASSRGVIIYPDEIANLFSNSGAAALRENILVLYSGDAKREVSRSQGDKASDAFIGSLVGGVQPGLVSKLRLDVPDGLLPRFLVTHPDPREIADQKLDHSLNVSSILAAVRELDLPAEISLDSAAANALQRNVHKWARAADDADELMQGVLHRAAGNALRVALSLEVLTAAVRECDSVSSICAASVRAACDLMSNYYIPTTDSLSTERSNLFELAAARYLARKILELRPNEFVVAEFREKIGKRCRDPKMMYAAVELCIKAGTLRRYALPADGRGRRAQACEVNPEFLAAADVYLPLLRG